MAMQLTMQLFPMELAHRNRSKSRKEGGIPSHSSAYHQRVLLVCLRLTYVT